MKILSIEGKDGLNLYPNDIIGGVVISQEEMRIISSQYHDIYNPVVHKLCKKITKHSEIKSDNLDVVIRYALIPILYTFLDRLVRVNKFIKHNGKDFCVQELNCNEYPTPASTVEFRRNVGKDYKFNDYILFILSKLWGIEKVSYVDSCKYNKHSGKVNNLSRIYPRNLISGLKFRTTLFLSKIRRGRIPVFGVAYAKAPLLKYGFYYKLFDDLDLNWPTGDAEVDDLLRSKVFTPDIFHCSEMDKFYESQKITLNIENVNNAICNFVRHFFPIGSLELFEFNISHAKNVIQKYNSNFIVARGGAAKGKFIIAAAKERNMKIIGIQHGGYYGYINDMHQTVEYEYRDLDIFISWGWEKLPEYKFLQNLKVISLPSPWLSERRKYWKAEKYKNNKKYDVLFMPSGVKKIPLTNQGATGPRIDIINDLSLNIKNVFDVLIPNNISLLFKPYDNETLDVLSNTLYNLGCKYGNNYNIVKKVDKGFSIELLLSSSMVLWNQPGTGFLECISAQIPTMVFWSRFSTKEEYWTEEIFKKLEKVGVVHSNTTSLLDEIQTFKKSPKKWMEDSDRVSVVEEFCYYYARVDDNWSVKWNSFFYNLV